MGDATNFKFDIDIYQYKYNLMRNENPKWAWLGSCDLFFKFWDPFITFEQSSKKLEIFFDRFTVAGSIMTYDELPQGAPPVT